jgi:hypothetical protein
MVSIVGIHTSVLNPSDLIIYNRVFGLARLDLATRQVTYNPIGSAPSRMAGLEVTPDKNLAYKIVSNGAHGNKRCEFWAFNLVTDQLTQRTEVPCRTRFTFGMSSGVLP